jgi:hypothetical protein
LRRAGPGWPSCAAWRSSSSGNFLASLRGWRLATALLLSATAASAQTAPAAAPAPAPEAAAATSPVLYPRLAIGDATGSLLAQQRAAAGPARPWPAQARPAGWAGGGAGTTKGRPEGRPFHTLQR